MIALAVDGVLNHSLVALRLATMTGLAIAGLTFAIIALSLGKTDAAILSAVVIWRHKDNIARLRGGTEPKIGRK